MPIPTRKRLSDLVGNKSVPLPSFNTEETKQVGRNEVLIDIPIDTNHDLLEHMQQGGSDIDSNEFKGIIIDYMLKPQNYVNARQTVLISETYKRKLDIISKFNNISLSNLINNTLGIFFCDDSPYNINEELKDVILKSNNQLLKKM